MSPLMWEVETGDWVYYSFTTGRLDETCGLGRVEGTDVPQWSPETLTLALVAGKYSIWRGRGFTIGAANFISFLQAREDALHGLTHPNPGVRKAALMALANLEEMP